MKVAVIGAGGFIGARVANQLAAEPGVSELRLVDRAPFSAPEGAQVLVGDFADPALRMRLLDGVDAVICLAAVLGGAAEADPALARAVNIDTMLDLIDALKGSDTRVVFASSIAVLGSPLPDPVTDATPPAPQMLYGAHKAMVETLLATYARRGWLDAVALRPAGVVARDGMDDGLKSAFLSRFFYAVRRGEDIALPVAEHSQTWLASAQTVARNFVQAATLPDLGAQRAITLPALAVRFGALVDALRKAHPDSPSRVTFAPDPETIRLFRAFPDLRTEAAMRLGFAADADVHQLVRRAF